MRIVALIPAYNAARRLPEVITGVAEHISRSDIVVVDDGSSDDTLRIAESCETVVLKHARNRGKGAALKTGFGFALTEGYDAVLTLDADGQHDPRCIPAFIQAQRQTQADIVVGSRMHDISTMPLHRRCSNTLTSLIISIRVGCRIPDSQSGFRWIRSSVLRAIPLKDDGYHLESELLIKARKKGARIVAVPIETIYRDEKSSIKPFRDTLRFVVLIIRSLFWT